MHHAKWLLYFPQMALLQAALFVAVGWLVCRSSGRTIAESAIYALMAGCFLFRLGVQSSHFLNHLWPIGLIHAFGNAAALFLLWRHHRHFGHSFRFAIDFFRQHPITVAMVVAGIFFRCLLSTVEPPAWFPFAVSERFLGPSAETGDVFSAWVQATIIPVDVMSYLAIGFGVYALSRRHAWPPAALSAMIVALSLARWAHPPMASSFEMSITAASLLALTALYRFLEHPSIDDGLALGVAIFGCWSDFPLGWLFPAVLAGLSLFLIQRRHGWHHLIDLLAARKWVVLSCLISLGVSMPLWRHHGGDFLEQDVLVMHDNAEGLQGAIQNAVRYGFQAAYIEPVRHAWFQPAGELWKTALKTMYIQTAHWLGMKQTRAPWRESGFGPFVLLLILPAWGYTLMKAPRRLKSLAAAMALYGVLLCLIPAWNPENLYLLSPMVAVCCVMVSFFLPPWRFSKAGQRLLHLACLLIWAYSLADVAFMP